MCGLDGPASLERCEYSLYNLILYADLNFSLIEVRRATELHEDNDNSQLNQEMEIVVAIRDLMEQQEMRTNQRMEDNQAALTQQLNAQLNVLDQLVRRIFPPAPANDVHVHPPPAAAVLETETTTQAPTPTEATSAAVPVGPEEPLPAGWETRSDYRQCNQKFQFLLGGGLSSGTEVVICTEESDPFEPLPKGWEKRMEPNNRIYFDNHKDRTTQWKDPRTQGMNQDDLLPPGGEIRVTNDRDQKLHQAVFAINTEKQSTIQQPQFELVYKRPGVTSDELLFPGAGQEEDWMCKAAKGRTRSQSLSLAQQRKGKLIVDRYRNPDPVFRRRNLVLAARQRDRPQNRRTRTHRRFNAHASKEYDHNHTVSDYKEENRNTPESRDPWEQLYEEASFVRRDENFVYQTP